MNDRIKVILPEEVKHYLRTTQNWIYMGDDPNSPQAYFINAYFEEDSEGNVYTLFKNPFDTDRMIKGFLESEGFSGEVLENLLEKYNHFFSEKVNEVVERLKTL